jgi:light-regulated signal transduction histidine kinase (bacteriophytochrome)
MLARIRKMHEHLGGRPPHSLRAGERAIGGNPCWTIERTSEVGFDGANELVRVGRTPNENQIHGLVQWLSSDSAEPVFSIRSVGGNSTPESKAWLELEMQAARELRVAILELITGKAEKLA